MIVYYSLYKYRIISNDDTFESHIDISYRYMHIENKISILSTSILTINISQDNEDKLLI